MKQFISICRWWLANSEGMSKDDIARAVSNDLVAIMWYDKR